VLVIGVGNALRHDDGVGLEAVRRMRSLLCAAGGAGERRAGPADGGVAIETREHEGDPLGLLESWDGARAVVLLDAIHGASPPGSVHRFDASSTPLPADLAGSSSTHAVGVAEAIELARALGRLPRTLVVYGVVGARFDAGGGLSEEVRAALGQLAETVLSEAGGLASQPHGEAR